LSSIPSQRDDPNAGTGRSVEPSDPTALVQRCVIIQRDEKGYGFTVSGDNPVFVASVKADGAASKAGVQQGDRIVKVNGTLVTSRNHLDVVKLIKYGSAGRKGCVGRGGATNETAFEWAIWTGQTFFVLSDVINERNRTVTQGDQHP
ncbi:Rho guanine nucleotide exchange factor 12, partial [Bulinus truncatus]